MKLLVNLLSYCLIGFGLSLLTYTAVVFLRWGVFPEERRSVGEGMYLNLLVDSRNARSNVLGLRTVNTAYNLPPKNFYLTLPSLNLSNLKVTVNVDSDREDVYFPVLQESLAHYEGTAL